MKKSIRDKILALRKHLSSVLMQEKSAAIKQTLFSLPEFMHAKIVMLYYSVRNEVYTHDIIGECLATKKIVLPKLMLDELKPVELRRMQDLVEGQYHIMEPKNTAAIEEKIDIIIVPGVAFDVMKNRLGTGKGYYDRFLRTIPHPHALKIGLAYDFQIVGQLPVEPTDVPMDIVITEKRVIR